MTLQQLNAQVFGLSVQVSAYQLEAQQRLHLPFELLSDNDLRLKVELSLSSFKVTNMKLYKRMTLIIKQGHICRVFTQYFLQAKTLKRSLIGSIAKPNSAHVSS